MALSPAADAGANDSRVDGASKRYLSMGYRKRDERVLTGSGVSAASVMSNPWDGIDAPHRSDYAGSAISADCAESSWA